MIFYLIYFWKCVCTRWFGIGGWQYCRHTLVCNSLFVLLGGFFLPLFCRAKFLPRYLLTSMPYFWPFFHAHTPAPSCKVEFEIKSKNVCLILKIYTFLARIFLFLLFRKSVSSFCHFIWGLHLHLNWLYGCTECLHRERERKTRNSFPNSSAIHSFLWWLSFDKWFDAHLYSWSDILVFVFFGINSLFKIFWNFNQI